MPKLRKDEIADLDVKVLDETEYTEGEFEKYEGEIPPSDTELTGYVARMWWCRTAEKDDGTGLDPMIKVMWIAGDNEGELEDFNGLPIIENLVLIPGAKFRWAPFLDTFGITLKAIKTSTYVAEEDDERWGGAPIEKIGAFVPGEDSDAAWSRVITGRRFWNDAWSATPKKWLPWETENGEDPEADAEYEEEDPDAEADAEEDGEEYDEDAEEDGEEDEPEPEPAPARARAARPAARAAKPAATTRAARPAAARQAPAARAAKPAAAAPSSRRAKPAAAKPAARGRGRAAAAEEDNEPPF